MVIEEVFCPVCYMTNTLGSTVTMIDMDKSFGPKQKNRINKNDNLGSSSQNSRAKLTFLKKKSFLIKIEIHKNLHKG